MCTEIVPPARGTFRNHCPACLTSRHVDEAVPGDRRATCRGIMPAIAVEGTDPDALDVVQRCERCGKVSRNRRAIDDDQEKLFALFATSLRS